jgi:hypothetical protein
VTLQGTPFHVNYFLALVTGETVEDQSTGVGVRVPLPNGRTFKSAGLVDYTVGGFVANPTHGGTQHLDALCAALS